MCLVCSQDPQIPSHDFGKLEGFKQIRHGLIMFDLKTPPFLIKIESHPIGSKVALQSYPSALQCHQTKPQRFMEEKSEVILSNFQGGIIHLL